jgi:3-hydroxyacyl-[acyl-carrier-protein] dehydratase
LILDPSEYDLNHVIADIEEIRRYNRQRYEMEQLTAVCHEDHDRHLCVGYKDLGPDEFWARGHMPGLPIMPGVVMCESAAQLASYYAQKLQLLEAEVIAFGGLQDVRFRGFVKPGNRFVVVVRLLRVRSTMLSCQFQCLVRNYLVCEGILKGVPVPEKLIADTQL